MSINTQDDFQSLARETQQNTQASEAFAETAQEGKLVSDVNARPEDTWGNDGDVQPEEAEDADEAVDDAQPEEAGEAGAENVPMSEAETTALATSTSTSAEVPLKPKTWASYWWVLLIIAVIAAAVVVFLRQRKRNTGHNSANGQYIVSRGNGSSRWRGEAADTTEYASLTDSRQAASKESVGSVIPSTRIPPRVYPSGTGSKDNASGEAHSETEIISESQSTGLCRFSVGFAQTQGSRVDQEDSYAISNWRDADEIRRRGLLAAVADGIGGLDDGQIASNTLMRSFCEEFNRLDTNLSAMDKLLELTARGQQEVLRINRSGKRCGTTLVALLIQDDYLSTISVGDSRIALYRAGSLLQLNREHVLARESDEQQALTKDDGPSPSTRQRGAITSYIGMEGLRLIDRTLNPIRLVSGDRVLLMSDGVFGTLSDDEIIAYLNRTPEDAAEGIIKAVDARKKPHQDNATLVIVGQD